MNQDVPSPRRILRWALPAMALAAVVYANSLGNGFAYDDTHVIVDDPKIQELSGLPAAMLEPYWAGEYSRELGLWRPLTTLNFGLQYALVGDHPFLYHAVNVVGHAVVTGLVVVFLAHLVGLVAAGVAGLLFAVHPVHVEAVANVVGLAEIQSAVFYLAACFLVVRFGPRMPWGRAVAVAFFYLLAFGTKESAVTLPGAVFLIDAARQRLDVSDLGRYVRERWNVYALLILVAIVLLAVRVQILGSVAKPFGPLGADLLQEVPRIWTIAEVWTHYVRLMVFPLDLSADYSPNVIPISLGWYAANLAGLLLALVLLVAAMAAWRRPAMGPASDTARTAGFGVVWFLVTISPVANVVFIAGVLLAERTLYLPSVGVLAALAWALTRLVRHRGRVGWAVVALVLVLASVRTWTRNPTWRNNDAVFGAMVADYPHSGRSQWSLGDLFFRLGDTSQGLLTYRAAIDILGPHYMLIMEIARKLIAANELRSSEVLLQYAYNEHPEFSVAPGLIAVIYSERGDAVETERWSRIALDLADEDPVRYHLLAWALTEQGRFDEAAEARRAAIALGEGDYWQQWASLAALQAQSGDTADARVSLDSARVKAVSQGGAAQVDSLFATLLGDPLPLPAPAAGDTVPSRPGARANPPDSMPPAPERRPG